MAPKKIVGIFAYPDDEINISGLLIRAYNMGMETHLIFFCIQDVTDYMHNNLLNNGKNDEVIKNEYLVDNLGVSDIYFLNILNKNRLLLGMESCENKLSKILKKIDPDYIITFESEGLKINSNRKTICNLTTKVFNRIGSYKNKKLYHLTSCPRNVMEEYIDELRFPKALKSRLLDNLSRQDGELTIVFQLTNDELSIKLKAIETHINCFKDEKEFCHGLPFSIYKKLSLFECYYVNKLCSNEKNEDLLERLSIDSHVNV